MAKVSKMQSAQKTFYQDLGKRVADLRVRNALSQEEMGGLVGLSRLETGKCHVTTYDLLKLASVLKSRGCFAAWAQQAVNTEMRIVTRARCLRTGRVWVVYEDGTIKKII